MAKVTDLPYEIWLQIGEYLPDHHVRTLYPVNRALYNIALDLRHKNATLGILPDRVIEETKPPILTDQHLASRSTTLQVIFYEFSNRSGPNVVPSSLLSTWKTFLPSVINRAMGHNSQSQLPKAVPPTVRLAQILHAMPKFTRARKLSFTAEYYASDRFRNSEASLIVPELVGFVGNRLRALHIQSPFVAYLPPHLESLESFSLEALIPYHTAAFHPDMVEKVAAFILAHRSTLHEVSFNSMVALSRCIYDVSPILQCLRRLPCLRSLSLTLHYWEVSKIPAALNLNTEIHKILETHQQHLISLSLVYICKNPGGWNNLTAYFREEWAEIQLPNVHTLTLGLPGMRYDMVDLQKFTHCLISLKISHVSPTHTIYSGDSNHELELFCQTLSGFPHLRELSLKLSNFNIDHLILFSRTLPHLRSLDVNAYSTALIYGFENLKGREKFTVFADWALESFDYRTLLGRGQRHGWLDQQMAIRLPNVIWINKKTRNECLSERYDKPDCTSLRVHRN